MKNKGKILGIDFGEKTVGLAITDEEQIMVFGRGVIKDFGSLEKLAEKLAQLCAEEGAVRIVIGIPLNAAVENEVVGTQAKRMRQIGEKLRSFLHDIPMDFQDESFSSFEAGEELKELGVKVKDRKQTEDEMAAIIILKKYLSKRAI